MQRVNLNFLKLILLFIALGNSKSFGQDEVEFLNGTKLDGKINEIRKEAKEFDFTATIAGRESTITYNYTQVHAVTLGGKRFVLTPKDSETSDDVSAGRPNRSKSQVLDLIKSAGTTPPDWFADTAVNPPPTLDLSWPEKPVGPWNASKNVGQYIWDRINPNESRWHEGIKLIHQCMAAHSGDAKLLKRDALKLGTMYFTLLQDYARAAYWFQKAKPAMNTLAGIHLAECYYQLGNKQMALSMMRGVSLHTSSIKLLAEMGHLKEGLDVARVYSQSSAFNEAFLNAGDACRNAGSFEEAIDFYQQVLDRDSARDENYKKRFHARARGAIEAIKLFELVDISKVVDGTYRDSSIGYNGQLDVEVVVNNKTIESVQVTKHQEKQFYAALNDTPDQIIQLQSVQGIDGTSGATITSQAIIHATAKALAQGAK